MSRRKGRGARQGRTGRWSSAVGRVARGMGDGVKVLVVSDYTPGDSPWVDGLVERMSAEDVLRCEHLERRPNGGFLHASEGYGRCRDCHLEHAAAEIVSGVLGEGRGAKCGRCQAPADPALLRPVAVELGSWTVLSMLCPVCAAVLLHEGQRAQKLATLSGGVR